MTELLGTRFLAATIAITGEIFRCSTALYLLAFYSSPHLWDVVVMGESLEALIKYFLYAIFFVFL